MSVQSVFRSNQEPVMDVWRTWKEGHDRFMEFVDELEAEFGREVLFTRAGISGQIVVGFRDKDDDRDHPPEGLRFDGTRRFLVPHKSTWRGKQINLLFKENSNPRPNYPGIPEQAMDIDAPRVYSPGIEEIDGYVYFTWGCPADKVTGVDHSLWERVHLSEWYALKGD